MENAYMNEEETIKAVRGQYEHDRNKKRLLLVQPVFDGLNLAGGGEHVGISIADLRPVLERLAHVLAFTYTRGRGDAEALGQLAERSIALSVAMDGFPDAREIFSSAVLRSLAQGRASYPNVNGPSVRGRPGTPLSDEERSRITKIYKARREARTAATPKRAPGRPAKSAEVKAAERAVREEFTRRRDAARMDARIALGRALQALDDALAQALRLTRQGVDVLAEPGSPVIADESGAPAIARSWSMPDATGDGS